MRLIDPVSGRVVWDSADPYAGPVPPAPEGRQWQAVGDMTPKAPTPQATGIEYYLGGTGLPNKLAALNQTFNPIEAIGQSMDAGGRLFSPGRSGWQRVEDTGNMLSGMAGVVAPTIAGARMGVPADESGALRLFHGSPHDFDRFSMDKIGTGEGAQAYGHGLYFAENEDTARWYRDTYDPGRRAAATRPVLRRLHENRVADAEFALHSAKNGRFTPRGTADEIKSLKAKLSAAKKELAAFDKEEIPQIGGRMYEVEVNANPDDFIDWDKPLSEQSEKVRNFSSGYLNSLDVPGQNLVNVYGRNSTELEKEAAQAGIHGIKYLDAGSRNYVVFDENLINIVRKYGIAGAATMLGVSAFDVEQAMAQGRNENNP